ncbi:acyl-CoA carboxylase subunit beta [Natrinema halophilum]|uniref:acyl-CoA carboxylase subunit beta n=1 Tax=Natrinema halophilum TaxID=1699371 RepID=UPI001F3D1508|nr:carboxyl transferase domain-containing protein [Natrinema halophilum]UHQ96119.1 acyl-CoA carboxylase [Natrinema halophilum]
MAQDRDTDPRSLYEYVQSIRREIRDEGRPEAVKKQHQQGSMTARERIKYLCDDDSFKEIGLFAAPAPNTPETVNWDRADAPADGIVTGIGQIDGRSVGIVASDYTVKGGSRGETARQKENRILQIALRRGIPVVMLQDGSGQRIQEGLDARTFGKSGTVAGDNTITLLRKLSGWVPTVSAVMGDSFGGPTNYSTQSTFVPVIHGQARMGVAGPALVQEAFGDDVDVDDYASAQIHVTESGIADIGCDDDEHCLDVIRTFLSYLPTNSNEEPPRSDRYEPPTDAEKERLLDIMPEKKTKGYDIHEVINGIVDRESVFEIKPAFARNLVTAFARIEGRSVGIMANNPRFKAGTVDANAADKAAQHVATCDAFGLPLLTLTDTPGLMPGPNTERAGIANHAANMLFEVNRATVPKLNVVLRRGYGFGYNLMASGRSNNSELAAAWPTAEICAMGIEGAVDIAYRSEIEAANDPDAKRETLVETFQDRTDAVRAAEGMGIDTVIDPSETRDWIAHTLKATSGPTKEGWPPKKRSIRPL